MRSVIVNEYQIDKVISFFLISPEATKHVMYRSQHMLLAGLKRA